MTVDEAVALTATLKPGLGISYLRMPDGGGLSLYRRVREAQAEIAPGFIVITGDLAAVQPLDTAASDVAILAKPFTASDLDALLTQIAPVRAG
jgi:CheY-like chemotaxis protein